MSAAPNPSSKNRLRPVAYGLTGGVLALALVGLARVNWAQAIPWMNANEGLASWVQALGSIAAILAVACIAGIEGRRASKALQAAQAQQKEAIAQEERRALARRASSRVYAREIATGSVERCEMMFSTAIKDHEKSLYVVSQVWKRDLEFLRTQLADVPKFLVEDAALVKPILKLTILIADVIEGLGDIDSAAGSNRDSLAAEREACRVIIQTMERRISLMRDLLGAIEKMSA